MTATQPPCDLAALRVARIAELSQRSAELERENVALRKALLALRIQGECWCHVYQNDPNMRDHSEGCRMATEAMAALKDNQPTGDRT